jgi:hypothetical protein
MNDPNFLAYLILLWFVVSTVWSVLDPTAIEVEVNSLFKGLCAIGVQVAGVVSAGMILGVSAAVWVGLVGIFVVSIVLLALND